MQRIKSLFVCLLILVGAAFTLRAESIEVVSPNGNETIAAGDWVTVDWNNYDFVHYGLIAIRMQSASGGEVTLLEPCFEGSGKGVAFKDGCQDVWNYVKGDAFRTSYTVQVPQWLSPGSYKFKVSVINSENTKVFATDTSDGYVDIVHVPPTIEVNTPYQDVHWRAGTSNEVTYITTGMEGQWLRFMLARVNETWGYSFAFLNPLPSDGYNTQLGSVPFYTPPGYYNLLIAGMDPVTGEEVSGRSTAIIRVSSPILTPREGQVLKAGQLLRVTWAGQEPTPDKFMVYLIGSSLTNGFVALEAVDSLKGKCTVKIPKYAPSGEDYRIFLHGAYTSGATGEKFTVVNRKIPTPTPGPVKGVRSK